ncbi:hypothetical protein [Snodgrassella alvi]|uniref:hypothetical protein n=1 Tax=Snodgrassella alvi TaxID=1196083 RepID=UPI000C1E2B3A|nr:hypothetical protein [Snodgrassella alvi]PIT21783.1 hypothetical protein BGI34_00825 [Snodgrassella alvi]
MDKQPNLFEEQQIKFSISYDAEDQQLSEHRMDAMLLSKSIDSVARLIKLADEILHNKNQVNLQTYVTSPAKEGSLIVNFLMLLLNPEVAKMILNVLGFISITSSPTLGLFRALRKINGKEILRIYTSNDDETSIIELSDGEEIKVDKNLGQLIASSKVREYVKDIVSVPLNNRNQPVFKILNEEQKIELQFDDKDVQAIKQVKTNTISSKTEKLTVYASFSQINFDSDSGWKINLDGQKPVAVDLEDQDFFYSIRASMQTVKRHDVFKIVLEATTSNVGLNTVKKKYKVLQVLPDDRVN